jgi:phthalate 4,5-dioxygenase oxygenase subunit
MLTREENELLCRIGAETPMGQMMRRYWLPAITSEELEADGPPQHVRLLGEDLVAFRDSNGRVGLLDEYCPHRGASLLLARNEDCGLRCLYHGLKVDVSGRVVDMPTIPDARGYKDRVRAVSYPVVEAGGIVWAYMGPEGKAPPPMNFQFTTLPLDHSVILKARIDCNWVQCLEGVIDSAHTNYLHTDVFKPAAGLAQSQYRDESLKSDVTVGRPSMDGQPRLDVEDTSYGFRYAAIRKPVVDADRQAYIRMTLFVAPIYGIFPAQAGWGSVQAFVPIDDEHTMLYFVRYNHARAIDKEERKRHLDWSGSALGANVPRTRENRWLQDREAMKRGSSHSGIRGLQMQDAVVQESMGPLYDRSREHLCASDAAVVRMRRLMLQSVRDFMEKGKTPLGLEQPVAYEKLRAEELMLPLDKSWKEVVEPVL